MAGVLQHLRSSTLNKRPNPASMVDGQLAINYASGSPGAFFKDSNGNLVKVGPVHVGATAPNVSPASGGTAGNSLGEQWLDTSGGTYVFKIWDGAAWRSEAGEFVNVTGDTMTGALGVIAGDASTPGLFFSGDANTGLYSPGADQVALATNGTGRLFVDSSGQVLQGDSATGLAFSRSVITANPSNSTESAVLQLRRGATAPSSGDLASLRFTDLSNYRGGSIACTVESAWTAGVSHPSYIRFATTNSGATVESEKVRITSDGKVGVGSSSPSETLHLGGSSAQNIRINGNSNAVYLGTVGDTAQVSVNRRPTDGTIPNSARGTAFININGLSTGGSIELATSTAANSGATTALTIDSSQRVGIGVTGPTQKLQISDGTLSNFYVAPGYGSGSGTLIGVGGSEYLAFATNGLANERARIDSSGRLLVGTSTSRGAGLRFQLEGTDFAGSSAQFTRNENNNVSSVIQFLKTRGGSNGSFTTVADGDRLGRLEFQGADGTSAIIAAQIEAFVDGTPGANDMPGRLVFSTTADGASSPTERMRITSTGQVRLAGAGITFNGDTATANELDDYEEGTWTPDISNGYVTSAIVSYTSRVGSYTKIGRLVTVAFEIVVNTISGGGGPIFFAGLPFTPASTTDARFQGPVYFSGVNTPASSVSCNLGYAKLDNGNYYLTFNCVRDDIAMANAGCITAGDVSGGDTIAGTFTYFV